MIDMYLSFVQTEIKCVNILASTPNKANVDLMVAFATLVKHIKPVFDSL